MNNSTAQVSRNDVIEVDVHRFGAEASTLQWAPGYFPRVITTDLGNGQPMRLTSVHKDGTHTYRQAMGCISLVVWND